jgi:hypothetical protein
MNWRRAVAVAAAGLGLATGAWAQLEGQTVKGFRLPEYDADGKLKQQLYGETATFLQDGIIQLTGLKIEIFRNGEVTARIYSPDCAYDQERKRAASKDHIRIVTEKAVLSGDGFAWNGENEQFQIFKNAKVTLDGQMDKALVEPKPAAAAAAEKE